MSKMEADDVATQPQEDLFGDNEDEVNAGEGGAHVEDEGEGGNDVIAFDANGQHIQNVSAFSSDPRAAIERVTRPRITKYERARAIGVRAHQIALGAAPTVEVDHETNPLSIAEKEMKMFKIPLTIRRFLPDGTYENWKIDELNPDLQRMQ